MAKKISKTVKAKPRAVSSPDSVAKLKQTIAAQAREIREAQEQRAATGEILRMIARTPTDLQSVMDATAENAATLCDAADAAVWRVDGDVLRLAAHFGPIPMKVVRGEGRGLTRGTPPGRAIIDGQTIHIHDIALEVDTEYPEIKEIQKKINQRTTLAVPLLRDGLSIGAILIRRLEVRPFVNEQIKLLETFADQAVIAIENTRLFQELSDKSAKLESSNSELREALEQQTATSEVLQVIASSPTELQPVLDTVIANAVKLAGAKQGHIRQYDGEFLQLVAHYNETPETVASLTPSRPVPESLNGRAFLERRPVQRVDARADYVQDESDYQSPGRESGARSVLAVPLLREGAATGTILIWRDFVQPFTDRQVDLVRTFADQAVIAIENVRLFQELKEALEQQTATSQILGVIASSPTDIQPVLDAIAENAARVCNANDASIRLAEGNMLRLAAHHGPIPFFAASELPIDRDSVVGRALVERQLIHIEDLLSVVVTEFPRFQTFIHQEGTRTVLVAPLMREDVPIGTVLIRRTEVRPFTEKQIALLKTFADQAVIAIENVRLFKELQQRNRDLTEALEQQTATSEILRVISSSPTDVQPVFDTIARNAVTLCDSLFANVFRFDGEQLHFVSNHNALPKPVEIMRRLYPMRPDVTQVSGRVILTKSIVHMDDALADPDYDHRFPIAGGWRRMLGVPMMRDEGVPLGAIVVAWNEPGPIPKHQEELLKTFADQAVIAIENVRLFNELKESLEQQTATSEILGVIASSPTDIQPVLETITERAARVCGAEDGVLRLVDGNVMRLAAHYGSVPDVAVERPINRQSPPGRAVLDREVIQVENIGLVAATEYPEIVETARRVGWSATVLAVPLVREGVALGVIHFRRLEVRPFSDKQISLLRTFADQAVIAIENVRLFKELRSATQNCARHWSIRRQRRRCSASSAARRRMCSRCSTPSSRAPRGFVESMT